LDFALAILSGALLALSFPKFGHPAFAWIALAPLLVAVAHRAQSPRRAFALGLAAGAVHFSGTLYWLVETMTTFGGLNTAVAALAAGVLIAYLSLFGIATLVLSASVIFIRSRGMPVWLGYFGILVALLALIGGGATVSANDTLFNIGVVAFLLSSLWIVILSVCMLRSAPEAA